jgi:hypothetical protein
MPCRTRWEDHGIVWEYYGDVTGDEIDKENEAFFRDERRHRARYQIIDATGVTSTDWNARDVHLITAKDFSANREVRDLKLAFIVSHPDFVALVDEYIALSRDLDSSWVFRRFEDLETARAWLGAPDEG